MYLAPLSEAGGSYRSASAAGNPDGGSNWMAAEELGPLNDCSVTSAE